MSEIKDTSIPDGPLTFTYKEVDGINILLDVYLPPDVTQQAKHRPAVVYFHGGGLTVGNRRSWFPTWLQSQFQLFLKSIFSFSRVAQ